MRLPGSSPAPSGHLAQSLVPLITRTAGCLRSSLQPLASDRIGSGSAGEEGEEYEPTNHEAALVRAEPIESLSSQGPALCGPAP